MKSFGIVGVVLVVVVIAGEAREIALQHSPAPVMTIITQHDRAFVVSESTGHGQFADAHDLGVWAPPPAFFASRTT